MLEALQNPFVIAVVVLILLLLIAIPVVVRRRRASTEEVLPPPELGQSIDYTSLPYEEPTGWSDRFARASVATKLLLVLVPLILIVSLIVLGVTFLRPSPTANTPTVVPTATITNVVAGVAGKSKILVKADTTLPDGAAVVAMLKENGQDFLWYNAQTATAQVADGRISLTMDKLNNAPVPNQDQEYTVVLTTPPGGQTASSEPAKLAIPPIYQGDFFETTALTPIVAPTTVPATPATAGPVAPTSVPPAPTTPAPTVTPTATLTATVANGGNIREAANISGKVLGQLHAGEVVKLLEKTTDGRWYRVEAPEATGWVSATLLRIDRAVADQVPTPTPVPPADLPATVFNGGNLRDQPSLSGKVLDQINAGEKVQLLEKTRDGAWYKITNIRSKTGWVSKTLLTIAQTVIEQVPVSK
jgi:flagellar FliL protein